MTEIEQPVKTDIFLFSIKGPWLCVVNSGGGKPGKEFEGWHEGYYWQRRTLGAVEDGFGSPAGEPHGPFRTEAKARLDMMLEFRRLAGEQLRTSEGWP
jgi:hypothetical protein